MSTSNLNAIFSQIINQVQQRIAPVWPLRDYVAVNPYLGYTSESFLTTLWKTGRVRDGEMLMPIEFFRHRYHAGVFASEDIDRAIGRCCDDYMGTFDLIGVSDVLQALDDDLPRDTAAARWEEAVDDSGDQVGCKRVFWTVAEAIDQLHGTNFQELIVNEISRHVAAVYDQGQAAWPSPWKNLPLYEAWRQCMMLDKRAEKLGIHGLRALAKQLPESPADAVVNLVKAFGVEEDIAVEFLACQLYSVSGWASYVKYLVRCSESEGAENEDLIGLLAIRLAYDFALSQSGRTFGAVRKIDENVERASNECAADEFATSELRQPHFDQMTLVRYICQVASEFSYQRKLTSQLLAQSGDDVNDVSKSAGEAGKQRATAQMVFCIDVRSEAMRRNLELVSDRIETFGFAGFFGLPIEYVSLGQQAGVAQCPVLLKPGFKVYEGIRGASSAATSVFYADQLVTRLFRSVWRSFQSAAISCFSFVESVGILYGSKLLTNSFRWTRPAVSAAFDGIPSDWHACLGPELDTRSGEALSSETKANLAESILRNLGLTENFAPLVVFCGHASETTNNPYRAGLDCGACGGHSGEPNARFAALLLNDSDVRKDLRNRGISIPGDTMFVPAVHNTTTDEIRFHDTDLLPRGHLDEMQNLQSWTSQAASLNLSERAPKLNSMSAEDLLRRCADWSEVRPEWGLAGNAAFIVAPRSRTAGVKLDGRSFLHNYDCRQDPDFKVLELIMTAPMVVANWINLQYYGSTVDNHNYGSGNKAIHNIVGQFGTLLGNGGDLMTGLPWQSVHNGLDVQHEPLRLLVIIEAPRIAIQSIIEKHEMIDDLVSNGWLNLLAIENNQIYQVSGQHSFATC